MIQVLKSLTPLEFQTTPKLFLYYLKTLSDRIYKRSVPDVSAYEMQILKESHAITIVNHGHYTTQVNKFTFKQLEEMINLYFENQKKPIVEMCEEKQFILDLRF